MEIKEAIENVKESEKIVLRDYLNSLDTIADAIRDGYTLCNVDSAINGMNGLYTQCEEYSTVNEVVSDCIDILKEACL